MICLLKCFFFFNLYFFFQSSEDACWLFEDDEGRKHGPHSLLELYSCHQYGYLKDSVVVSYKVMAAFIMKEALGIKCMIS